MSDLTPNNVIHFPRASSRTPSPQEVQKNLAEMREEIEEEEFEIIVDMMGGAFIDLLENAGFYVAGDASNLKETCLVLEAIRSLIAKYYDIEHPFHSLANSCFEVIDGNKVQFINPKFEKTE